MPDFFNNCSKLLQLDISHNLIRHTEFIAPLQNL
jgi:Leucine-rich repeat (LRR) protein